MLVATLDAGASVSGQEHLCQADACWVPSKSFLQETRRSGGGGISFRPWAGSAVGLLWSWFSV